MHRLTARLLLLFTLVGTFAPLALASAAPVPQCCVRKGAAVHHCHEAASAPDAEQASSEQATFTASATCSHDCCRGAVTSQVAQLQSLLATLAPENTVARLTLTPAPTPVTTVVRLHSTRGPPAC